MKKLIGLLGVLILALAAMPLAFAEQAENTIGQTVAVGAGAAGCSDSVIYKDHTARVWMPNDQTQYTAAEYGTQVQNAHGYTGWEVPLRQNYMFAGETLKYFIIVKDMDGVSGIGYLHMVRDVGGANVEVGDCKATGAIISGVAVTDFNDTSAFVGDDGTTIKQGTYDPSTMKSFVCTLVVPASAGIWSDVLGSVSFRVHDLCMATTLLPGDIDSNQLDWLYFNPTIAVGITGAINFPATRPNSTAMSNTITVNNAATAGSGVMMDMYIAADDYFTDPTNADAICGDGNGIKYDRFAYYATKGSINSGANDNTYPGLGETASGLCISNADEFTNLTSNSGHISDMCRIINHGEYDSLLAQGSTMSLTFQLKVPTPCSGTFSQGNFHIVGAVV